VIIRAKPPSFKSDDSEVEELIQLKADCRNVLHVRPPFTSNLKKEWVYPDTIHDLLIKHIAALHALMILAGFVSEF